MTIKESKLGGNIHQAHLQGIKNLNWVGGGGGGLYK